MPELRLVESQKAWSQQALQILDTFPFYIDTSTLGAGKTVLACWLALKLKLDLFVISPLSILTTWEDESSKYNVSLVEVMTYNKLQMLNRNNQPSHPYLELDNLGSYRATKLFKKILAKGILLIFDECYMLKNKSKRNEAANALIKALHQTYPKSRSRYGLLSNTLFDKEKLIFNFLSLLQFFTKDGDRKKEINNFFQLASRIEPKKTKKILNNMTIKTSSEALVYQLYIEVVKYAFSGGMDRPRNDNIKRDVKNGFYYITEHQKYQQNLESISAILNYDIDTARFIEKKKLVLDVLVLLNKSMQEIEYIKALDMARLTKILLRKNPKCKVIICLFYIESQERVLELLPSKYTVVMNGQTSAEDRRDIVRQFNEPNLSIRVLILSTRINAGLSLHDTDGNYPRTMFITPNFHMIDLAQTAGRIDRVGVQSKITVRMFYGLSETKEKLERVLIDHIYTKSKIIKNTINYEGADNNILPGEYQDVIEDDDIF